MANVREDEHMDAKTQWIHLYHLNDLHSHFENWPKIRRFLNQKKREHEASGEDVLLFDNGDFLDRVHPLTESTNGKANVHLMNQVSFDAATIGNNEGIGNTKQILNRLYDEATFPIVLANLFDVEDGQLPEWVEPSTILTTKSGMRVGVTGLTAPLYLSYLPNGWQPKESYEVLPKILPELAANSDIVVLLSHMGIIEDEHMAEMYEELDVIIGGHTHHVLPNGKLIDGTMLTGGGKWGQYIGHTSLLYSNDGIQQIKTELIDCAALPEHSKDLREVDLLWKKGTDLLEEEKIADLPFSLTSDWYHSSDLLEVGLDAITEFAQVDVGMLNAGLFLDDLPEGVITKGTMHRVLPHPMRLITCKMDGKTFKELIWNMERQRADLLTKPVMGMGFRGKIFGSLAYKGIKVDSEQHKIYYRGNELADEEMITFVTVDHYRYVSFFPLIENKGESELLFPYFLRDIVSMYLAEHFPLTYH